MFWVCYNIALCHSSYPVGLLYATVVSYIFTLSADTINMHCYLLHCVMTVLICKYNHSYSAIYCSCSEVV